MAKIDLDLEFVYAKGPKVRGKRMCFAVASPRTPFTPAQKKELTAKFEALRSCEKVVWGTTGNAVIESVLAGVPGEEDFCAEVLACTQEHYNLRELI